MMQRFLSCRHLGASYTLRSSRITLDGCSWSSPSQRRAIIGKRSDSNSETTSAQVSGNVSQTAVANALRLLQNQMSQNTAFPLVPPAASAVELQEQTTQSKKWHGSRRLIRKHKVVSRLPTDGETLVRKFHSEKGSTESLYSSDKQSSSQSSGAVDIIEGEKSGNLQSRASSSNRKAYFRTVAGLNIRKFVVHSKSRRMLTSNDSKKSGQNLTANAATTDSNIPKLVSRSNISMLVNRADVFRRDGLDIYSWLEPRAGPSSVQSPEPAYRRALPRFYSTSIATHRSRPPLPHMQQCRFQHTQVHVSTPENLPLAGIRVLDMTRVLAGPYCTQILGDHGAEVIKVEHPIRGDDTRAWGPPYAPYEESSLRKGPGEAAYFLAANRNKKSIGLSFQDKRGVRILHELVKSCDVLVENYLPGSLKKYGLDYETMAAINPQLIYVSITGYGQTGPYSKRAGYDVMVEAEFGLMHITGERDGPPVKVGVAITDLTSGLYACNATMASLLGRAKSGKGEHVDVALSDCQTASLANIASSALVTGKKDSGRWGTAHPSIVPYRGFKTADGDILIGGGNDKLFGIMCERMGKKEWIRDERFVTNEKRVENRQELEQLIEDTTRTKTTQQWLDVLEESGMPYAAINDVQQTLQHEHTKARGMVTEVKHKSCGPMKLLSPPVKYLNANPSVRLAPPVLGEHTEEILSDLLKMPLAEIEILKGDGVIS